MNLTLHRLGTLGAILIVLAAAGCIALPADTKDSTATPQSPPAAKRGPEATAETTMTVDIGQGPDGLSSYRNTLGFIRRSSGTWP